MVVTAVGNTQTVNSDAIYATIREEILDQKKCQFQLFSLAVTGTALILAYSAGNRAFPLVYLAPIVMNDFALIIILDKAVSIQRKVGYLQMMEQHWKEYLWMWETQLDSFRAEVPLAGAREPARKHGFVTTVGVMLIGLNVLAALLGAQGSAAAGQPVWPASKESWPLLVLGAALLLGGAGWLLYAWRQLVGGRHSGPAIRRTWEKVLNTHRVL